MIGKNLLSLISILFAGSQLISMANAACDGINLTMSEAGATTCALSGSCDAGFYAVKGTDTNENTVFTIGIATAGEVQKYVKVTAEGCSEISTVANVAACARGQFEAESGTLCLDDDKNTAVLNDGKNYLYEDSENVFGGVAGDKVVITSTTGTNSFIKKTDFATAADDYCVRKGVITDRVDSYCKGDCDYHNCHNGVCGAVEIEARTGGTQGAVEETPDASKCNPAVEKPSSGASDVNNTPSAYHCGIGYYITNGNDLFASGTDPVVGTLYYCSTANDDSCDSITGSEAPIGYYKNGNTANLDDAVKYIKCDGTNCKAVFTNPSKEDCSTAVAGELIQGLSICSVDSDATKKAIALTGEVTKYFVPVLKNSGTIFDGIAVSSSSDATKYSIIVEVDAYKAVVATKTGRKYKYTDADYKIYDVATDGLCDTKTNIKEFILSKEPEDSSDTDKYDYYSTDNSNKSYTQPTRR